MLFVKFNCEIKTTASETAEEMEIVSGKCMHLQLQHRRGDDGERRERAVFGKCVFLFLEIA